MLIMCQFVGSTHIESAYKECQNQEFNARICDESKDQALMEGIAKSPSSANLSPTAVTTKKLTLSEAKDFYEVYNGVVKEYSYLVEQLLAGSVIALQIECNRDNKENEQSSSKADMDAAIANSTFHEFREFVGPKDPEIAKY